MKVTNNVNCKPLGADAKVNCQPLRNTFKGNMNCCDGCCPKDNMKKGNKLDKVV